MVDHRVHQPDVDGQPPGLAGTATGGRGPKLVFVGEAGAPLLGLGQPPHRLPTGEPACRDQQVGGPTEAIATDQRQLEQHVLGVLAEPPEGSSALLCQGAVEPLGLPLDLREEVAQGRRGIRHGSDSFVEGLPELRHGDSSGLTCSQTDRIG